MSETLTSTATKTQRNNNHNKKAPMKKNNKPNGRSNLTPEEKAAKAEAMSEGRRQTKIVRSYLEAVRAANSPKRRGRKQTPESVRNEIAKIQIRLGEDDIDPVEELKLHQRASELRSRLEALTQVPPQPEDYLQDFTSIAKSFSDRQGISYAAWRQVGVAPKVLKDAGISR